MGHNIHQVYIILDDNDNLVDWRDTKEDALAVINEIEQDSPELFNS